MRKPFSHNYVSAETLSQQLHGNSPEIKIQNMKQLHLMELILVFYKRFKAVPVKHQRLLLLLLLLQLMLLADKCLKPLRPSSDIPTPLTSCNLFTLIDKAN